MSAEGTKRFYDALRSQVEYFKKEYELSVAEAIGCIEILKLELHQEQQEILDDDD